MSLWPPRREDQAKLDASLGRKSKRAVRPPDEKRRLGERTSRLRVSMCQIAWASRRAMSTWATLAPRCLPSRRLVALVALGVGGVAQRVHRRLEQRPAQVGGPVLGERAAAIRLARLDRPAGKGRCSRSSFCGGWRSARSRRSRRRS